MAPLRSHSGTSSAGSSMHVADAEHAGGSRARCRSVQGRQRSRRESPVGSLSTMKRSGAKISAVCRMMASRRPTASSSRHVEVEAAVVAVRQLRHAGNAHVIDAAAELEIADDRRARDDHHRDAGPFARRARSRWPATGADGRGRRCRGCRSGRAPPSRGGGLPPDERPDRAGLSGSDRLRIAIPRPLRGCRSAGPSIYHAQAAGALDSDRIRGAHYLTARQNASVGDNLPAMEKSLFRYIWRHSKRDQLIICRGRAGVAAVLFRLARPAAPDRQRGDPGRSLRERQDDGAVSRASPSACRTGSAARDSDLSRASRSTASTLLFGLSGLFLFFVLINGAFKYWINVAKGALGERMLRRMRFDLFALVLRFTPEALRTVKSSETATIIKDEVEPIGGFIGDAFITAGLPRHAGRDRAPVHHGAERLARPHGGGGRRRPVRHHPAAAARTLAARQAAPARLAPARRAGQRGGRRHRGRARPQHRTPGSGPRSATACYELFDLRFRIYKRKFMVKFLNNLLAQMTPFFFYAVGGYFALTGRLDIGQLVAVIAAYRELPPPLKELIDWDQQRLDVQVKYDQVVQHFAAERLLPADEPDGDRGGRCAARRAARRRRTCACWTRMAALVIDACGVEIALPARDRPRLRRQTPRPSFSPASSPRRRADYGGVVAIGGATCADLPRVRRRAAHRLCGRRADPVSGHASATTSSTACAADRSNRWVRKSREALRRIAEAQRTGNPIEKRRAIRWIDHDRAGARDERRSRPHPSRSCASAWGSRMTSTASACPARSIPNGTPSLRGASIEARGACGTGLHAERHGRSRRAVRSARATAIRRRSPKTCSSESRPPGR